MAGVAQEKELSGVAESDKRQRLNKAREELSALPIHFDSTLFEGFPELEDSCRAVKMEKAWNVQEGNIVQTKPYIQNPIESE